MDDAYKSEFISATCQSKQPALSRVGKLYWVGIARGFADCPSQPVDNLDLQIREIVNASAIR